MDAISDVSRGSEIFSSVPTYPPIPRPINLDDLFGFSEAARKRLVEEPVEPKYFVAERIFINQVDSFTGKYIVSSLLNCSLQIKREHDGVTYKTEEKGIINSLRKETTNNSTEKYFAKGADKSPSTILKETIRDLRENINEDNPFIHDTSKLTVAEYYEMMELESLESRNEFLNEKLGKIFINSDLKLTENELESHLQDHQPADSNSHNIEYEIVGTLKNRNVDAVNGVKELILTSYDDPEFLKQLVTCGVIIYCVNDDLDQTEEATWALNSIISFKNEMKNSSAFNDVSLPIFILVSTFMTWGLTKPLSLSEQLPFIETDYRKRKPHPNYDNLFDLEEQIVNARKEHMIRSVVIVSGIPYGYEENELRYLFEKAYYYQHVPIYSTGKNLIPTIHIENLAQIVKETLSKINKVTVPFIFAKDPTQNTMEEISKAVSSCLGTGYCEFYHKEHAFVNDMISQDLYNKITTNIFLESCYPLFQQEDICWKYESGFTENINQIVKEFVGDEKMKPLRITFYGTLSDRIKNVVLRLSKYFNIPYVNPEAIIVEYINEVLGKQAKFEQQNINESGPQIQSRDSSRSFSSLPRLLMCEDEKWMEAEIEILLKLNIQSSDDVKQLQESDKLNLITRKLSMSPYIYQGYAMEEYPQTLKQANIMFSESNKELLPNVSANVSLLPDIVIFFYEHKDSIEQSLAMQETQLEATEEHDFKTSATLEPSREKLLMNNKKQDSNAVSEENLEIHDTENINEIKNTMKDDTMLLFFSNLDERCSTVTLDVKESDSEDDIFVKTLNVIQSEHYFHYRGILDSSSVNEQLSSINTRSEEKIIIDIKSENLKSRNDIENKYTQELKEAEEIILAVRSYPLLSYLINYISQTLTKGILEVTDLMPEDPIDFLAEYIFKNNPDGRMMPQNELKLEELMRMQKKTVPQIDSKACLA